MSPIEPIDGSKRIAPVERLRPPVRRGRRDPEQQEHQEPRERDQDDRDDESAGGNLVDVRI